MSDLPHSCEHWAERISLAAAGCLSPDEEAQVRRQIETCPDCRERFKQLTELCGVLGQLQLPTNSAEMAIVQRVMSAVEQAAIGQQQHQSRVPVGVSNNHFFERVKTMILAHRRLSVAAAATLMALAASLILYVSLLSFSTAAYALEQTVQANNHVTSYHVKITPPPSAEGVGEAWVQLNPDGTPLQARMHIFGRDRGERECIVSKSRCAMWSEAKKLRVVSDNKELIARGFDECMKMRALFDPKLAFEQLQADRNAGKVQVAAKEPSKKGEPITLTVTSKGKPDRRRVYEVDSESKLVQRVIEYRGRGDQWEQVSQRDYLDYNKEIDPKIFQPELSQDMTTIDQAQRGLLGKIGLAQGDLTEDQIATKLAKKCFEALIAGDYQTAGLLNDGIPGKALKKAFEQQQIKFLRIVEIGKPTTVHEPRSSVKILSVPARVEMETKGKKTIENENLRVRRVDKNSDRWSIGGGL